MGLEKGCFSRLVLGCCWVLPLPYVPCLCGVIHAWKFISSSVFAHVLVRWSLPGQGKHAEKRPLPAAVHVGFLCMSVSSCLLLIRSLLAEHALEQDHLMGFYMGLMLLWSYSLHLVSGSYLKP